MGIPMGAVSKAEGELMQRGIEQEEETVSHALTALRSPLTQSTAESGSEKKEEGLLPGFRIPLNYSSGVPRVLANYLNLYTEQLLP